MSREKQTKKSIFWNYVWASPFDLNKIKWGILIWENPLTVSGPDAKRGSPVSSLRYACGKHIACGRSVCSGGGVHSPWQQPCWGITSHGNHTRFHPATCSSWACCSSAPPNGPAIRGCSWSTAGEQEKPRHEPHVHQLVIFKFYKIRAIVLRALWHISCRLIDAYYTASPPNHFIYCVTHGSENFQQQHIKKAW